MAQGSRDEATERLAHRHHRRLIAVWNGGSCLRPLPDEGTLVIGRGAHCDVFIDHRSVSRTHALLHVHPGGTLRLEDRGSANGTRVGGRPLAAGVPVGITSSDIIEIGAAKVLVEASEPLSGPVAPGGDAPMDRVWRLVELVGPSDLSVVLHGETGTGKEVVAERIHAASLRMKSPMLRINCASLSDAMLESELFGHVRGSFTGAVKDKVGLLEAANGGTVLLDEVGELPLATQAKLLRALESRELRRVGAIETRPFDVRFIAASNRDLRVRCEEGAFRQDLFFRLNGITISLPPLRVRRSEIGALAVELLARAASKTGRVPPTLTPEARAVLERAPWPGNVRELRNVMERALVLSRGPTLGPEHLAIDPALEPAQRRGPSGPSKPGSDESTVHESGLDGEPKSLREHMGDVERQRVTAALAQCAGNQTKAALVLGMSRRTLVTRLREWGTPRPRK